MKEEGRRLRSYRTAGRTVPASMLSGPRGHCKIRRCLNGQTFSSHPQVISTACANLSKGEMHWKKRPQTRKHNCRQGPLPQVVPLPSVAANPFSQAYIRISDLPSIVVRSREAMRNAQRITCRVQLALRQAIPFTTETSCRDC